MNRPLHHLFFFLFFIAAVPLSAQVDTLHLSLDDGFGKRGSTYAYPVRCLDSLTAADSVYSGEFTVSHDNAVFDVVGIDTVGTLLGNSSFVEFSPITRTVAFARTGPVTGTGVLVYLLITIRSDAAFSTSVSLVNGMINEGNPWDPLLLVDEGSMRPMDIYIDPKTPPQDRVVGDTVQFSVFGDVTLPVTWSVSDTHIVSIDANGTAVGKNVGQAIVTVTDAQGLTDQSFVLPVHPPSLRSLTLAVRDTSIMQNLTFDLPLTISDVSSLAIVSAQFTLQFNPSILQYQGIVRESSMTQSWSEPAVNVMPGKISAALAGTSPLSGSGILAYVRFKVQRYASFSSYLDLTGVLFNENFNATLQNGTLFPLLGPAIDIAGFTAPLIGSETVQLSASGGTAPYRWKLLSDPAVAEIDSLTGFVTTFRSGRVTAAAIDANGFDGTDSTFVSDVRAVFPDTGFIYSDSIDVPITVSSLTGLSILSGQLSFSYDTVSLRLSNVQQLSTLTESAAMEYRDSAGHVSIAFSSTAPLSGSGPLLKLRFTAAGPFSAGYVQPLYGTDFFFNETGPEYRYVTQIGGILRVLGQPNNPPFFTQKLRDTTIAENQTLTFQLKAADPDGDSLIYGLVNAPIGMAFDPTQGLISWTPNSTQAGTYHVRYDVGDYHVDGVVADSAVITVTNANNLPVFTRAFSDTAINEDQLMTFDIDGTDTDGDAVRYYIANIQPGMQIDTMTGLFNWRPSFQQSGSYALGLVLNDGNGVLVTKPAVVTVNNVNRSPVFTKTMNDTSVLQQQTLIFDYAGADPDNTPLTFTLVSGPTPAALSAEGHFEWMPGQDMAGPYMLVIGLSDGTVTVRDTAVVTVLKGNNAPVFTQTLPDTAVDENVPFSFGYKAFDPEGDTLFWEILSVPPAGLTLSHNGTLQWTPSFSQSGMYAVVVGVRDHFVSAVDTAVITVRNINRAPFFSAGLPDISLGIDSLFTFPTAAVDPDNDSLTFAFVQAPASAQITSQGLFSWKPGAADLGKHTIIISAGDGSAVVTDTAVFDIFGFPQMTVSQFHFDFGSLTIGGSKVMTGTVGNSGHIPLVLHAAASPNTSEHFLFDSSAMMTVPAGETKTFEITYQPLGSGTHDALFVFVTNDPRIPLAAVTVKGLSVAKAAIRKKILVDNAHGNALALDDTAGGIAPLFKLFGKSGMALTVVDTALHPQGYDALLLITPSAAYTNGEIGRIGNFVNEGGLLVAIGDVNNPANGFINAVLNDSLLNTGLTINANRVTDTVSNEYSNSGLVNATVFIDPEHPFFTGVDTLLVPNSASISVQGKGIPLVRTSPFGRASSVADSVQPAVIGLSSPGKGKVLAAGSIDAWRINPLHDAAGVQTGVLAKDNLPFAMNVFTVTEEYEVKLPTATPNERYQLVSIPFDLENAGIAAVLKDLGGVNPLVWRLFGRYNVSTGRYAEFPGVDFNTFRRGEAYWLITRGAFNLTFGNATIVSAQDYYPIRIGPGYSMIGNPFPYTVSWKDSRKGDSVQTMLWKFDGASFQPESLALEPFAGYFVKNLSSDSVTIYINPVDVTPAGVSKSGLALHYGEDEWRITVSAASGKNRDDYNVAGVARSASTELDPSDVAEPPNTPTDYVIARFTNTAWQKNAGAYAVDIRPAGGDGIFWDMDVTTAKPQSKVNLSFGLSGNIPSGFRIYLIDKRSERAIEINSTGSYDFTMGKNETRRSFRLMAGKQAFIEENTGGIPLVAQHFALLQNYPNPFNPTTLIQYTLGNSGTVTVAIYNVLGQKVRTVINEFQPIGSYRLEWDGKDESGATVASGVYFYKIVVHSNGEKVFTETKKMVMMK